MQLSYAYSLLHFLSYLVAMSTRSWLKQLPYKVNSPSEALAYIFQHTISNFSVLLWEAVQ